MKLVFAVTCEEAEDREDGRLDVHGYFHELYAPGFPAEQNPLTFAAAVEWDREESGAIRFTIELLDPAGAPTISLNGETDVPPFEGPRSPPRRTHFLVPLGRVIFPAEGEYRFVFRASGQEVTMLVLPLRVQPGRGS